MRFSARASQSNLVNRTCQPKLDISKYEKRGPHLLNPLLFTLQPIGRIMIIKIAIIIIIITINLDKKVLAILKSRRTSEEPQFLQFSGGFEQDSDEHDAGRDRHEFDFDTQLRSRRTDLV